MTPRRFVYLAAVGTLVFLNGCNHSCFRKRGCNPPPPGGPPIRGGEINPNLPPQGIPIDPPPSRYQRAPEILLPESMPKGGTTARYAPMPSKPAVTLGDPETPAATVTESTDPAKTKEIAPAPPMGAGDNQTAALPVGIADFAMVKEGVYSGMRADLDGLNWLKAHNFKTVLFLKRPGEDDSSDRQQVEKRQLKYLSLTISPEKLSRDTLQEFNQIVGNTEDRSLFVYDRNGIQAGAMWYLHFRTVELADDDQAQVRAGRHGLKTKGSDEQVSMWTAVQKLLAQKP